MSGGLDLGGESATVSIAEALGRTLDRVERNGNRWQICARVSSGYPVLDVATGGMPSGAFTVISGSPGAGKTALALAIGRHLAGSGKGGVLYVAGTDPI